MADEPEDPVAAADRLEAALERIALLATIPLALPGQTPPGMTKDGTREGAIEANDVEMSIPEIAERLDALISRLRAALGGATGSE